MKTKLLTAAILLSLLDRSMAQPACDDRIDINNPARFPFNTIATVRFDRTCSGTYRSWGTGALVGPHMLLTAGHVVYNRNAGKKNQTCNYIQPGAYHDSSTGDIVYPYGERVIDDTKYKKTNNKWADQTYSPKTGVDYGAIHIVCPFEDINTYMPMVFDLSPDFINTSGYPVDDLPSSGNIGDQWRGAGSVTSQTDRILTYDQRSTGGASGAPVWIYNAQAATRRITAVNVAHSTQCNGMGPRLVWQNENLLNDWLDWQPSVSEAASCVTVSALNNKTIADLVEAFNAGDFKRFSKNELKLTKVSYSVNDSASYRVYQVIQNQKFIWEEYYTAENERYLKLIEPQSKWLSQTQAQALLSASESWTDQKPSGMYEQRGKVGQIWVDAAHNIKVDDQELLMNHYDDTIDKDYDQ